MKVIFLFMTAIAVCSGCDSKKDSPAAKTDSPAAKAVYPQQTYK